MFDEVRSAVATLKSVVVGLEPGCLDGPGAVSLVGLFAEAEHVAAAGKAIATRRVDETQAYRAGGHRTAAHWLATTTGVNVGQATHALRTAEALDALPATSEAFRAGELSEVQAYEITTAASADPSSETRLLDSAKRDTVKGLKDRCARVLAASVADDAEWAHRLHDQRAVSRWTEHGIARMDVRFAPEAAGLVFAALDAETDLVFREARAAGKREPRRAYMHDALANLIARGPTKPIDVRLNADASGIARGHVIDGERCEIDGIGPIPVTTARALLADARVTTMVKTGDAITHVTSMTRTIPAKLRRWLEVTYPKCGRKGCNNTQHLQIDHITDYAEVLRTGELPPTTAENTWRPAPPAMPSRPTKAGTSSAAPAPGTSPHPTTPTTPTRRDRPAASRASRHCCGSSRPQRRRASEEGQEEAKVHGEWLFRLKALRRAVDSRTDPVRGRGLRDVVGQTGGDHRPPSPPQDPRPRPVFSLASVRRRVRAAPTIPRCEPPRCAARDRCARRVRAGRAQRHDDVRGARRRHCPSRRRPGGTGSRAG